jgi:hypothetical protein
MIFVIIWHRTTLRAQGATPSANWFDDSSTIWLYVAIAASAYALSLVFLLLFLRDVKRSDCGVLPAAKTFALSFLLFLLPGIALGVAIALTLAAVDVSLAALQPVNAIIALVAVRLAYRRTRRTMRFKVP